MGQTIAEKIFYSHVIDEPSEEFYVLRTDSVFCHEITTPPAIVDLARRRKDRVFDPSRIKVVIDHVTPAKDSKTALQHKILRDWAVKHGIDDFFDVGRNGICHALFPEKGFVRPGCTIIMGDSHTCTYGAFGALGVGVGTTDLEVGILKGIFTLRQPKTIKVRIMGKLPHGVYAKDVVLKVISTIGVSGATDCVIEYSGEAVKNMSMESRMTICNMAIEAGATTGICMPDEETVDYLWMFISNEYRDKAEAVESFKKWHSDKDCLYEKEFTVEATQLEPLVTYGYRPDCVRKVSEMESVSIDQVYIGSCTNARIEDLRIAAMILKGRRLAGSVRGIVSPATSDVFYRALEEGILKIFAEAGFCITNPTCGACLGMSNGVLAKGEVCVSTTNRNFYGRMGRGGMVHLASPATAAASAIEGKIADPRKYL